MVDSRSLTNTKAPREPDYQRVVENHDMNLRGFVVVDTILGSGGTGGIRMADDITYDEIASLASEMTLKFAWLNIPRGGAKAGIVAPPAMTSSDKEHLCTEFGRQIADLLDSRLYMAGEDLGIDAQHYDCVMVGAGRDISVPTTFVDSSYFTALTVFVTANVVVDARGGSLSGTTVLIEGFGKVGSYLAQLLRDSGAVIVGVSTASGTAYDPDGIDIDALLELKAEYGDDCVRYLTGAQQLRSDELFLQNGDILIPGARPYSINAKNIGEISASLIIPVANIPATEEIEQQLFDRDVTYVPGFVSNCGGILSWYLARLTDEAREALIRSDFAGKVSRLVAEADRTGEAISCVARRDARRNLQRMLRETHGKEPERTLAFVRKLAPGRLGYAIGKRLLGKDWSSRATAMCHWYYQSTYFR